MKSNDPELVRAAGYGYAAILLGAREALRCLQAYVHSLEALEEQAAGEPETVRARKKRAGPGWSADPEERKREMARRQAVRRGKERWKNMSAAQQQAWKNRMADGKRAAAKAA